MISGNWDLLGPRRILLRSVLGFHKGLYQRFLLHYRRRSEDSAFCDFEICILQSAILASTIGCHRRDGSNRHARGRGLALDGETAQLCSLSVELEPLRYANDVARLLKAMCRLPAGLPNRAELIAESLGGDYSRKALEALVSRLGRSGAELLEVSASLPQAGPTVYLIPPVDRCRLPVRAAVVREETYRPAVVADRDLGDGRFVRRAPRQGRAAPLTRGPAARPAFESASQISGFRFLQAS